VTAPIDSTTARRVLAAPLPMPNRANARTVADYLTALLSVLWRQESDFSGKRPFGMSGWQHEVYEALFRAGFDVGVTDEAGVREVDLGRADLLVQAAITELGVLAREVAR
jgi:hypothetical protein